MADESKKNVERIESPSAATQTQPQMSEIVAHNILSSNSVTDTTQPHTSDMKVDAKNHSISCTNQFGFLLGIGDVNIDTIKKRCIEAKKMEIEKPQEYINEIIEIAKLIQVKGNDCKSSVFDK